MVHRLRSTITWWHFGAALGVVVLISFGVAQGQNSPRPLRGVPPAQRPVFSPPGTGLVIQLPYQVMPLKPQNPLRPGATGFFGGLAGAFGNGGNNNGNNNGIGGNNGGL